MCFFGHGREIQDNSKRHPSIPEACECAVVDVVVVRDDGAHQAQRLLPPAAAHHRGRRHHRRRRGGGGHVSAARGGLHLLLLHRGGRRAPLVGSGRAGLPVGVGGRRATLQHSHSDIVVPV